MVAGLNGNTCWLARAQRALHSLLLSTLHQLQEAADTIRVYVESGFGLSFDEVLPGTTPLGAELSGPHAREEFAQVIGERLERFFDELLQILEQGSPVGFDSVHVDHQIVPSRRMRSPVAAHARAKKRARHLRA
jgi:hypothetical protein